MTREWNEISMDAGVVAVLSELDGTFTFIEEQELHLVNDTLFYHFICHFYSSYVTIFYLTISYLYPI